MNATLETALLPPTEQPEKIPSLSLLRLATVTASIHQDQKVADVARIFQDSELTALGVIDSQGKAIGLVTREHLLGLLGKPFGYDVLGKKAIGSLVEEARCFSYLENLFLTAEKLTDDLSQHSIRHYVLTDNDNNFRGVFSSKDLLTWLSRITQEDITLAAQLQERLVKARAGFSGHLWFIQAFSQSAKGLGGDFYHVIPLDKSRVFVALGDVSGKGVAASILTSLLWGVLQFYDYRKGLRKLISQLNLALIRTFHLEKYLTGIFMLYDSSSKELLLADMGHGHSALVRAGKVRPLRFPKMNLPLGIDLELQPTIYRLKLQRGDLVCLYTDGLTEQENAAGKEFGEQRVWQLAGGTKWNKQALPEHLLEALSAHQGAIPRADDVSWLQLLVD